MCFLRSPALLLPPCLSGTLQNWLNATTRKRKIHPLAPLPLCRRSLLKPAAISSNDFFDWNPAISPTTKYFPMGYRVKVPPEKLESFVAAQRRLVNAPPAKTVPSVTKRRDPRFVSGKTPASKKTLVKRNGSNRASLTGLSNSIPSAERQPKTGKV